MITTLLIPQFVLQVLIKRFNVIVKLQIQITFSDAPQLTLTSPTLRHLKRQREFLL